MKKIIINGRFYSRIMTGVDRFAIELVLALDKYLLHQKFPFQVIIAVPSEVNILQFSFKCIEIKIVGKLQGFLWEQLELPLFSRGNLLLNFCNSAPIFKCKQIVVIHDAAPSSVPESYSLKFRLWYRFLMPWIGLISKRIVSVSNFSAKDISHNYKIPINKISVVTESGEHILKVLQDDSILSSSKLTDRPYVLAVSSMSPHKNFKTLVKAVELLGTNVDFDLVIAGGLNPKIFATAPLPDFVKYVGYVSDERLKSLYTHAFCFVFPSYYEGFGLPAVEAMALGCPVIASNAASIPEVCGDAAIYFSSRDYNELASCIHVLMSDKSLRQRLKIKGLKRSSVLTWQTTAKQIINIILNLNTPL